MLGGEWGGGIACMKGRGGKRVKERACCVKEGNMMKKNMCYVQKIFGFIKKNTLKKT